MVLPCFKILACAVIQLFPTVCAANNTREQIGLSRPCRAAFVLPQFLHQFPCISVYDCFVGILEHKPFFFGIVTGFLVLVGLLVGLEVYCMPLIFWTLQNVGYGIARPVIGIVGRCVSRCPACLLKMDCRRYDFILFQNTGNL